MNTKFIRNFFYLKVVAPLTLVFTFSISNTPAQALRFNFSYASNVPEEVIAGFTAAGKTWSSNLTDDVTVNIYVQYGGLPNGVLAGTRPGMVRTSYSNFLTGLVQNESSATDVQVLSHLPIDAQGLQTLQAYNAGNIAKSEISFDNNNTFSMLVDGSVVSSNAPSGQSDYVDNFGNDNNKNLWMTRANAKALGIVNPNDQALDATIRIGDSISWDFTRSSNTSSKSYNFLSVAKHEISHCLGFISGVDAFQLIASTATSSQALVDNNLQYVSPLDLFRYSKESAAQGVFDWTPGRLDNQGNPVTKYFSLDGGQTSIADFASGVSKGGDGYESSHWAPSVGNAPPIGIMTPDLNPGQRLQILDTDLQALDAIGWTRQKTLRQDLLSLGLNWSAVEQRLTLQRQLTVDRLTADQTALTQDPTTALNAVDIETLASLQSGQTALEQTLAQNIDQQLSQLAQTIANVTDPQQQAELEAQAQASILQLAQDQSTQLAQLSTNQSQTLASLFRQQMLQWLGGSTSDLTQHLANANLTQLQALSSLLTSSTYSDEQESAWNTQVLQALTPLSSDPEAALAALTSTSGPDLALTRSLPGSTASGFNYRETAASIDPTDSVPVLVPPSN